MLPRLLVSSALVLALFRPAPDVLQVGRNLSVAPGQQLRNVSCILCSVELGGEATGNVRVFAGNVFLHGTVDGNVLVFGGHVTLAGTASAGGYVLVLGGHLQQDPTATVGRHIVLPPIIFLPVLLLICALIGALIRLTRRSVREPAAYPPLPRL